MIETEAIYDPVCGAGKYVLTPPEPLFPRINGPAVFGVRPGSPFFYAIPATGQRPVKFEAEGLPEGLSIDKNSGVISGKIATTEKRRYTVKLRAENEQGTAEKDFGILVGDEICLTPPMGWNSWNCWKKAVSRRHVLNSAKAMAASGLKNYGWSYINIDDSWQGERGGKFNAVQPAPEKFPDMKQLCADIHALGLKVGIYSSPWITTYAGYAGGSSDYENGEWFKEVHAPENYRQTRNYWRIGKYRFAENDAAQWAEWGIDYLKYDWNPNDPENTERMADALKNCGRDIVYSLSNSAPVEHAALFAEKVHCWRTGGDLMDRWDQEGIHLNIIEQWQLYRRWVDAGVRGGPGHFPDADMLVIGPVVTSAENGTPVPSRLTADEQYSHVSLWVLWACPLLIGCPIEQLDDFTFNLLTNAEVLEVHQDEAAIPGRSVDLDDNVEVVVKDLADGEKAIGIFNRDEKDRIVSLGWEAVGLEGKKVLRDLWRQKDIDKFNERFTVKVRPHGVVLLRTKKEEQG